jgi:hypothetical protein
MMTKQSEFFASGTVKNRTIDGIDHRTRRRARQQQKPLRLLLPINLAYEVHVGRHG